MGLGKVKSMSKKLIEPYSLPKEEEIKQFWKKYRIPDKVRRQSAGRKKKYYFMDGPPYATGPINLGTALNKISKDVAIRYKRMKGFHVFDRPGYDTHGVPIENKVENQLGFRSKKDIEAYGVKKFIDECRRYATEFIGVMNDEFNDLGVWMDWSNPYLTLSDEYIESIWWTFKKADEKGLLYLGTYPVHICPRCATAVAYNEIEYAKQTDNSVFVKFRVRGKENTFLVIWTTTPWTLPGNTGVMAHPKFEYVEAQLSNGETWILAKELVQGLMDSMEAGFSVKRTFPGKELEGMQYENPLSKHLKLPKFENAYRVIMSERYVNLDAGSGLVHTAPGHGKEDFDAGTKAGLPTICPVNLDGTMNATAGKYAGKMARVVDKEIIGDLRNENALVYEHPYTHDYPLCWRCKSPLLMLSVPQWFFRISSIRDKLLQESESTYWVPYWAKDRMRNWLEQLGDWPISRSRYWGSPLPIWVCSHCSNRTVVESIDELKNLSGAKKIIVHKPEIDDVKWQCKKCGKGEMRRVPEVLDVWFDSGVSSWAALGGANSRLFKEFWPADLNLEGTDQFRGWWNSEIITSVICFDKKPFKNIVVHGIVTDVNKRKMSKSDGNDVKPAEVIQKYNRDFLRYYLIRGSDGHDIAFNWNDFEDVSRVFNVFMNTYNYMSLYLGTAPKKPAHSDLMPEDLWILSRMNSMLMDAEKNYEGLTIYKIPSIVEQFVMEDLSRTYIKLIRDRTGTKTEAAAAHTLHEIMHALLKVLSPIMPHACEYIYRDLRTEKMEESVHLCDFPSPDKKFIDAELEKQMELAKNILQTSLSLREEQKLRLRWPLNEIIVRTKTGNELKRVLQIIAAASNVKKASESTDAPKGTYAEKAFNENTSVFLNTSADKELQDEWELMELRRRIQDKRKQAKLMPQNKVELFISCSDASFLKKHSKQIESETNTTLVQKQGAMERLLSRDFYIEINVKEK